MASEASETKACNAAEARQRADTAATKALSLRGRHEKTRPVVFRAGWGLDCHADQHDYADEATEDEQPGQGRNPFEDVLHVIHSG